MPQTFEVEIDDSGRIHPLEPISFTPSGRAYLTLLPPLKVTPVIRHLAAPHRHCSCWLVRAFLNDLQPIWQRCSSAFMRYAMSGANNNAPCVSRFLHGDLSD